MAWRTRAELALGRDPHLGTVAERLAAAFGDRPLVEQPADERTGAPALRLTFRQAAQEVVRLASAIGSAAAPGERVVVAVPNGYDVMLLCLAAARAGCVPVPVNDQMRPSEVEHVVDDSGAVLVVRSPDDLPRAAAVPPPPSAPPGDVAALFYTSGTTGKPKGVRLSHRSLVGGVRGLGPPRALRRDLAVHGLPTAHIYGFLAELGFAGAGVPSYVLPRFRPTDALDAIERRRATIFAGVPAMYRLLLEAGAEQRRLSSVRMWLSGADAMPEDLARRFQKMGATASLPGLGGVGEALFVEGYGMVELGGACAIKVHTPFRLGPDTGLGVALPGWKLRVDAPVGQVGELLVRGPGTMLGYHGAPEATADVLGADGWLRTGDLARQGPLGTITFAGRAKHVVKKGGYSVYALEVEQALEEHPAVAEASVVGLPDERLGERVGAAIRLLPGATATADDVLAFARDRLAAYKVPDEVIVVDELPRTGTEKVQKERLKERFSAG